MSDSLKSKINWHEVKHFRPEEFRCRGSGQDGVRPELVQMLDTARGLAGIAFRITSGYRSPEHNAAVGGSPTSSHITGLAADIAATTDGQRMAIVAALVMAGCRRIGINFKRGFIHADVDTSKPPALWEY